MSIGSSCPILEQVQRDKDAGFKIWLHYGTSATPPHVGHVGYLELFVKALAPDKVIVVPNRRSPFKTYQIDPELKWNMTVLAFSEHPEWVIDRQEIDREGPSYASITLENLNKEAKKQKAKIYTLISSESVEEFYAWHNVENILKCARVIFGNRPGHVFDEKNLKMRWREINAKAQHGEILDSVILGKKVPKSKIKPISRGVKSVLHGHVPIKGTVNVSSTLIRNNVAAGKPITGLVHPRLEAFLKKKWFIRQMRT